MEDFIILESTRLAEENVKQASCERYENQPTLQLSTDSQTRARFNHYNVVNLNPGLPQFGGTCPGATAGLGGCLECCYSKNYLQCDDEDNPCATQIYNTLLENTKKVRKSSYEELVILLRNTMWNFVDKEEYWTKHGYTPCYDFRIHTVGDFCSADYTKAWSVVIKEFPTINFLAYTRSFAFVQYLIDCPNLILYLSRDKVNEEWEQKTYDMYKANATCKLLHAPMGDVTPLPDQKWIDCPHLSGAIKNGPCQGACFKCGLCRKGIHNIRFRTDRPKGYRASEYGDRSKEAAKSRRKETRKAKQVVKKRMKVLKKLLSKAKLKKIKKKVQKIKAPVNQFILATNRKTKFGPNHKNTFGLTFGLPINGGTCPGATSGTGGCLNVRDGCKRETCYMAKVTQIYKAVAHTLQVNTDMVRGKSYDEMVTVIRATIKSFTEKNLEAKWYFRLHYSGDFFSEDYAKAWAQVIGEFPRVKFWVYTRSFNVVPYLIDRTNITVYLSIDPVNMDEGSRLYEKYIERANLGLAWLGNEKPAKYRWVTCPETSGILKNTNEQGTCAKCRLCIDRYKSKVKNIQFTIH